MHGCLWVGSKVIAVPQKYHAEDKIWRGFMQGRDKNPVNLHPKRSASPFLEFYPDTDMSWLQWRRYSCL